jgi:PIN domain nuclease of toxin-antitoxin system
VSSASIWEAAIKKQLNKLEVDIEALAGAIITSGFVELPIASHHAVAVSKLPLIHRDPFDRILVAQAISEPLHLITCDATLAPYSELVQIIQ